MRTVHFWAVRFYETSFYYRGDFMIREELDRLLCDAKSNAELKEKLLKTEQSENPIDNFCSLCRSHGYKISAGELFALGLDESDTKLRSVNGGGVNAIDGWDDAYEQFILTLKWT